MYRIKRMAEKIASGMSGRMAALVLALTMIAALLLVIRKATKKGKYTR